MAIGFGFPLGGRRSTTGASVVLKDFALFKAWHDLDYGCRISIITISAFPARHSGPAGFWSGLYTPFLFLYFLLVTPVCWRRRCIVYILEEWRMTNLVELMIRTAAIYSHSLPYA